MRFLKELFNPKLKCVRLGHKMRSVTRKGYARRWAYKACEDYGFSRAVAYRVRVTSDRCSRIGCWHESPKDQHKVKVINDIDDLTMSSRAFEIMDDKGVVFD